MILISGIDGYKIQIWKGVIPKNSRLYHENNTSTLIMPFSRSIMKCLDKYFKTENFGNYFRDVPVIEITKSDIDVINYNESLLEMHNLKSCPKDFFTKRFINVLNTKSNLQIVPKYNGKYYLTFTLFNCILSYLGLDNIHMTVTIDVPDPKTKTVKKIRSVVDLTFKEDFQRTIRKIRSFFKVAPLSFIEKQQEILSQLHVEMEKFLQININSIYCIDKLIDITKPFVKAMYMYFKLFYLEKKQNPYVNLDVLEIYDSKYVCLIESTYLRILAREKNKPRVGFVHFYKYFAKKNCDCSTTNLLLNSDLRDHIEFIYSTPYIGCDEFCLNYYKNDYIYYENDDQESDDLDDIKYIGDNYH